MDTNSTGNSSINNANNVSSGVGRTSVISVHNTTRKRKTVNNLAKRSFQNPRTLKQRLAPSKYKYTRQLLNKSNKLLMSVDKYLALDSVSETANLYSYLFLTLGESMADDLKDYFFEKKGSNPTPFLKKAKRYITDAGLKQFHLEDEIDSYVSDIVGFMEWLVDNSSKHPEMRDEIDDYAKHLLSLFRTIFTENKKEFLKTAPKMNMDEKDEFEDFLKAFSKSRI